MALDPTEANRIRLLFFFGVVTPEQVIAWSNAQIEALADPPTALFELSSTCPSNTGGIITNLTALSCDGDYWKSLRAAMPQIYEHVEAHPDDAERLANELYLSVVRSSPDDVPNEFKFIYRFDDAFTLAREGIYGNPLAVHEEFLSELHLFVK